MAKDKPLTAKSSIGTWLKHPAGGPLIRDLLTQAGVDERVLTPLKILPLQQLVTMSQGQMPQSMVDDLVLKANGGVAVDPEDDVEDESASAVTGSQRFAGRTVIVTGAASGIGRATAERIAREGGRVIAVDISEEKLNELAATLPASEIVVVAGDITKQESVDAIVAAAGERIDGLANVAGINDDFSPLHETSDAMWDRVIGVNLTGAFKLSRAVIPVMLAAGQGSIVNIASEAGLRGNASGNAYTVSKHGVIGLTRSAAFMYGREGLRINAVAPGGVATGIPFPPHVSESGQAKLTPYQMQIPTLATAEQLAASITFLLSDDGVNINGVVLPSDGGWSIQ
ncbi:SDR family NAD(P)-dependent oxidoreductase [Amnibacterium flavum]|uniref:Short-chain dehydrogenase n=1 Tax=Amnibacterium flavum TaxID=2173173 RepID=A0A2V1HUW9_9MICO|nr:SDR family oxidoreductase [Amnibacterium flavum]PVZ96383.1 short-chain dehydrogenase [Amnibacterium flavum]